MPYFTQNEVNDLPKDYTKNNKIKRVKWLVQIKNPINQQEIKMGKYCSLKDISNDNTFLPYDTWRNIAVGRSNVYDPFININKDMNRDLFYCPQEIIIEENKNLEEMKEN